MKRLWLVPVFMWFQPWFARLSFTAITEVPFALVLTIGVLLASRRRWALAAVAFGAMPLIRWESAVIVGIWIIVLIGMKRWSAVVLSVLPMTVYGFAYLLVIGRLPLPPPATGSIYGHGTIWHFVWPVVVGVGIPLFSLSIIGFVEVARRAKAAVVLTAYCLFFVLHSVLFRLGLFATAGYGLFLLPIAPLFAIGSAFAVERLLDRSGSRRTSVPRAFFVAAIVATVLAVGFTAAPYRLDPEGVVMKEAAAVVRTIAKPGDRVITYHAWFAYDFGLGGILTQPVAVDDLRAGSIVVWDRHYAPRFGLTFRSFDRCWTKVIQYGDLAAVFQRTIAESADCLSSPAI